MSQTGANLNGLIEKLHKSNRVMFVTGAGISVEGGIPVLFD
jgi:NAD-dependent SIR2 family protein deacetylase